MSTLLENVRAVGERARRAAADSAWTPLLWKVAAYLVAFVLLALVGSGRLAKWLSPPRSLPIAVAEAATAPPPIVPAGAMDAGVASAPQAPSAAPIAADAGTPVLDGGATSPGVAPDGKVILNLATEDDLRRLPGIGRTRARGILELRTRMKKLTRVEDLLKVKGIGRRSLARLRPLVRLD